jgi:flagellar motor switch protein FliN/FliY
MNELLRRAIESFVQAAGAAVEALSGITCQAAAPGDPVPVSEIGDEDREVGWIANLGEASQLKVCTLASRQGVDELGRFILEAAGLENFDDASLRSTYFEILAQAVSGWSQSLASLLGEKVELQESGESSSFYPALTYFRVHLTFGEKSFHAFLGLNESFFARSPLPEEAEVPVVPASPPSAQYELLLDVELPVSISFGRALVPLKEILKLNSGSIVELDRAVTEPVEVIVNNCVIARGEVVVVEGNYGVRIQQIISRNDRLKTMK